MSMARGQVRGEYLITQELGISHADLDRVLPRFVAPIPVEHGNGIKVIDYGDGRKLVIEYFAERERRIGSLRITYTPTKFRFLGWAGAQIEDFLHRFEVAFRKGGG